MHPIVSRPSRAMLIALLGTASFLTMAGTAAAQNPPAQTAQASPQVVPEQVLVTGSLIHGAVAVGVPVPALSQLEFQEAGALTISDA